jgi:FkbM family methyltransferase
MKEFKQLLEHKIVESLVNNFGIENFDEYRFGKYSTFLEQNSLSVLDRLKNIIKTIIGYQTPKPSYVEYALKLVQPYEDSISVIWSKIGEFEKDLLVSLIAYRTLGYTKIKLARNNQDYWDAIEKAKQLANNEDKYDPHFMHFILEKFELNPIGYNVKLYFSEIAIAIDFIIEQYALKREGKKIISADEGDVVLDIGGCWGDTALYFASKVGENGKVYSFEFIPDNIKLFNINTSLNENLLPRISLIQQPVYNEPNVPIYFKDNGPGSSVQFQPFDGQSGETITTTIDSFVNEKKLSKVDFIKMDIEGAEMSALEGGIETIRKFRPKLAIAIYHSLDDFFNIPNWILALGLDYEIFIDHYTIHAEETICFAKPKAR